MAKSDARFEYKANLSRTDFDLSQRMGFTSAPGMLLPLWFDFASPGDSYYIQHDLPLLRSSVLAAPAMVDVKVHFETFFVPMQMLYQPFEQSFFSLQDVQSSNFLRANLMNYKLPLLNTQDYIDNVVCSSANVLTDKHTDCYRLFDMLGLNASNLLKITSGGVNDPRNLNALTHYAPNFFPYQILCYNAILMYYYLLDDKAQFFNGFFNWDAYYDSSLPVTPSDAEFTTLGYRPWDFDYFTSMYRSPIVSSVNTQSVLPSNIYSDLISYISDSGSSGNVTTTPLADGTYNVPSNDDIHAFGNKGVNVTGASYYMTNTAIIRQMFANERLAMITGRTKKNYDSQVLAHFGVNVPKDIKHDLTLLQHDVYDLQVQEVTSLATTTSLSGGSVLGELAGKSYAVGNGKQFKFTAPVHGVVMTIFSIEPKKRYFGGFDRINSIGDCYEFPIPDFDRLGNVPMFRFECGSLTGATGESFSDVIGWKERYYPFKRKFDKTTLAFGYDNASGGNINNYSPYMLSFRPFGVYPTSSSARPRPDVTARFYIERNCMDAMCLVPFQYGWLEGENSQGLPDGENWSCTPWLVYGRDPFIVNSHIKCKKVSWMSKDGEPIYPY